MTHLGGAMTHLAAPPYLSVDRLSNEPPKLEGGATRSAMGARGV